MKRLTLGAIALVLFTLPAPARAQTWEMSGMAGHTQSAGLDKKAPELSDLDVQGGFTFGIQFARFFTPNFGVEALWTDQMSALQLETGDGGANLFSMAVRQLHGNAVYQLGAADSRLRPFVFAGLGATFLTGDELQSETKMSFGIGGGVKYFPWQTIGIRGHVRYKPTMLKDEDAGRFCDPFGFCQGTLQQIEFAVGAVIRF
jgi:opacity protein-like surface antigen